MPPRPDLASPSLLSPGGYDDDASLRSLSEQDSDSSDDEFLRHPRTTLELAEHDRGVLEEEDEMEKLLIQGGPTHGLRRIFSPSGNSVKIGKRERRQQRRKEREDARRERRRRVSEEGELLYEVEEGHRDDSSLLSTPSSEFDRQEKGEYIFKQPRRISWWKLVLVSAAILVVFLILVLGAYKASGTFRASHSHNQPLMSNGSALFAPTTILISLDGFRADFLNRGLTPTLNAFVADGVSPQYMLPSFPSVTFPNHITLVTGLYPESHGIVSNTFWDPELQEQFFYTHQSVSMQPKWYNAEPIWNTAEIGGMRTAIHMWPGSEAHIGGMDPTILDKYNGSEVLPRKVDRILELLDLPGEEDESLVVSQRPQLIAAYVPNVDADGHKYGPNSTETRGTISQVDTMLGNLFTGIRARNLTDIVNIVIVSDHGMATTSNERLVQLDDLIDMSLIQRMDGWPSRGLHPKRPEDLQTLAEQLERVAENYSHAVEVYTKETMPERYHFTNNNRIAPLWVIPKTGWAIVERPEFDITEDTKAGKIYHPKGIHGYDHEHPLMRAIFVARGPAFPHTPNSRLEAFQNTNVYNIICDSLGITPLPNNGTLRLPLKPVGLHSDADAPTLDSPQDPPPSRPTISPVSTTSTATPDATSAVPGPPPAPAPAPEPDGKPEESQEGEDAEEPAWWGSLWGTVENQFEDFKDWAGELIDSVKDNIPFG